MVDEYKQQFSGIMEREVTRGEFVKFLGVLLLSMIGVIGFIRHLHEVMPAKEAAKKQAAAIAGYGRSAYGR